jgi:hypothetical protein
MHDCDDVASDAFAGIFRGTEETIASGSSWKEGNEQGLSNEARAKRSWWKGFE